MLAVSLGQICGYITKHLKQASSGQFSACTIACFSKDSSFIPPLLRSPIVARAWGRGKRCVANSHECRGMKTVAGVVVRASETLGSCDGTRKERKRARKDEQGGGEGKRLRGHQLLGSASQSAFRLTFSERTHCILLHPVMQVVLYHTAASFVRAAAISRREIGVISRQSGCFLHSYPYTLESFLITLFWLHYACRTREQKKMRKIRV